MRYIFFIIYGAWLLSEILLNRLLRADKIDKQKADKGSLLLIWLTIFVSIPAAILLARYYAFPIGSSYQYTGYTGLVLIVAGILLRLLVIASLGRHFTVNVTIRENHKLKKDGVYQYVRHPSYTASLISFAGFGISLNNWLSLGLILVLILFAFLFRISVEEKTLTDQFGNEYLDYMKRTKRLIPFIY